MADSRLLNTGTKTLDSSTKKWNHSQITSIGALDHVALCDWITLEKGTRSFQVATERLGCQLQTSDRIRVREDGILSMALLGMGWHRRNFNALFCVQEWVGSVLLLFSALMRRVFRFLGVEWACGNPCFWSRRLIEWLCDKWVYSCRKLQANLPQKHQSEQKINRLTHCLKTKPISILFFQVTITNISQTNTSAMFQAKQVLQMK